jgi:hypothetical protein
VQNKRIHHVCSYRQHRTQCIVNDVIHLSIFYIHSTHIRLICFMILSVSRTVIFVCWLSQMVPVAKVEKSNVINSIRLLNKQYYKWVTTFSWHRHMHSCATSEWYTINCGYVTSIDVHENWEGAKLCINCELHTQLWKTTGSIG